MIPKEVTLKYSKQPNIPIGENTPERVHARLVEKHKTHWRIEID